MIHLIDAILVLVLLEAAVLHIHYRRTGRGIAPVALLPNLAAGFFLMVAIRLALSGAPSWALPACLFGALVAHLADLSQRRR